MKIQLSSTKSHLLFLEDSFDEDGIATSSRIGSRRIDPARADKALAAAQKKEWEFSGEPINGFYEVVEVSGDTEVSKTEPAANEIAK